MDLIEKVKRKFWPKLKSVMFKIPFTGDLVALYYSMMDPETPLRTKLIIAGALAYFIFLWMLFLILFRARDFWMTRE
ncbi:hypothetical protein LEP1GSC043_1330 [Leptospira weilii str. Ecochallenge]|uniref:Uncharacterized protein n=1 Tax=Leptospira weilii str. Ecochallenge TaxID=1049986 RepID=N1TYW2_9LEPT|nr:hypothetical protein LEP1GSC043_1330 [Leptospira weilii str. Ecochallenge]